MARRRNEGAPGSVILVLTALLAGCGATADGDGRDAANGVHDAALRDVVGGDVEGQPAADATPCARWVLEAHVTNARDVGGLALAGGGTIACRRLLRGGDLTRVADDGCDEFAGLGIRTVIDLRQAAVQASDPPPACVLDKATRVAAAMPKLLPDTPENYLALFEEHEAIATTFATLGEAASYPVYLHCVIGRDRASFVTALALLAAGASRETVAEEFTLSAEANVAVKSECISATLDELDRRGGIESFLHAVGVADAHVEVLRAQLAVR